MEDAVLLVSELVTNAIRHTASARVGWPWEGPGRRARPYRWR
ncbi:hypothetical protein [Acrocarpospora catenulata]|nr:hypothetical protein [Acrocarpospora catenulata]